MADLPRIFVRPELPQVGLPRVPAHGARFLAETAQSLEYLSDVARRQQQPIDFDKKSSEYDLAVDEFKRTLPEEDDTARWEPQFARFEGGLRKKLLEGVTDRETKQLLERHFQRSSTRNIIDVRGEALKMGTQQRIAYAERAGKDLSQQAAEETDPEKRDELTNRYKGILAALSTGPTPAITQGDAAKHQDKFDTEVQLSRAYHLLETNPGMLKGLLATDEFSKLTGSQRNALKNHSEAAISEQKRLAKEAEQERVDVLNTSLLERNATGKLTGADVLKLSDKELPFQWKRFWMDRLQQQAEQRANAAERAEAKKERAEARADRRRNDPFVKSDGATLATVMQGVLTEPDKWTPEKILGYMGNGLSVTHAQQAVTQLAAAKKAADALPRGADPLANAIKSLDTFRREKVFIPADKRTAFTPEDSLQNDLKMQGVMDQLIERAGRNEDPQKVLNELMQPFYEQSVAGWFDWARGRDPAKEQVERTQARQFLARAGLAVTEDAITKAVEHLKQKKATPAKATTEY